MIMLYLSIPLMVLAVAIATAPLIWATRREASWDEAPVGSPAKSACVADPVREFGAMPPALDEGDLAA